MQENVYFQLGGGGVGVRRLYETNYENLRSDWNMGNIVDQPRNIKLITETAIWHFNDRFNGDWLNAAMWCDVTIMPTRSGLSQFPLIHSNRRSARSICFVAWSLTGNPRKNASLLFPPALKLRLPQPRPQLNAFQLLADFECDCLDLNSTINNLNNNFVRDFLFSALKIKLRHHITYLNEIRTLSEFKMRYWTLLMAERMSVE